MARKSQPCSDELIQTLRSNLPSPRLYTLLKNEKFYSWVILQEKWLPSSNDEFEQMWMQHPKNFGMVKLFGQEFEVKRWQQSYGFSYSFSGQTAESNPFTPQTQTILNAVNNLCSIFDVNQCFVNWYGPDHFIGPHSDDERQLVPNAPIFSLSWGQTRTFRMTPKKSFKVTLGKFDLELQNGDLLIMGGDCQKTHKHEVLKLQKKAAPGRRINFSMRCFRVSDLEKSKSSTKEEAKHELPKTQEIIKTQPKKKIQEFFISNVSSRTEKLIENENESDEIAENFQLKNDLKRKVDSRIRQNTDDYDEDFVDVLPIKKLKKFNSFSV